MFGFGTITKLNEHIQILEKKLAERQTELMHMHRVHEMYKTNFDRMYQKIEKLESKGESK